MPTINPSNEPTGAINTVLIGQGIGTASIYSAFTMPAATVINQILFSSAANTISGLATLASAVLITSAGGVPSLATTLPNINLGTPLSGTLTNCTGLPLTTGVTGILGGANGGTGINNGANTITIGGNITTAGALTLAGAFAATFNFTAGTNVTFPTAGTLATTASASGTVNAGLINQLAYYAAAGTAVSGLATANNGLLVTSNAGVPSILAGPGTTGNILQSNAAAPPSFSTATYPSVTTINQILFSTAANVVGQLATANSASLVTTSAGVPIWSASMTNGQVIIGSTGATPVAATLTPGAGIGIAVAAGSITITNTGVNAASNNFFAARLTLTTGVPVTTANVTAATNIYVTPYKGNNVALFTAGAWQDYLFTETTLAVPNTASQMYDVFLYDNAGTLTLDATAWTNDTTRATALAIQDGVYCKTGALARRYVGSFRTTSVMGQTEDSLSNRFVWNFYNRVLKPMSFFIATQSWSYTSTTIRQANANAAAQINFIVGVSEDSVSSHLIVTAVNASNASASAGIGLNSTTAFAAASAVGAGGTVGPDSVSSRYVGYPAIGKNSLTWLEAGNGSIATTFYGATGGISAPQQSAIIGEILC